MVWKSMSLHVWYCGLVAFALCVQCACIEHHICACVSYTFCVCLCVKEREICNRALSGDFPYMTQHGARLYEFTWFFLSRTAKTRLTETWSLLLAPFGASLPPGIRSTHTHVSYTTVASDSQGKRLALRTSLPPDPIPIMSCSCRKYSMGLLVHMSPEPGR